MMMSHKLGDEKRGKKEPKIDPTHLIVNLLYRAVNYQIVRLGIPPKALKRRLI